jgi:beta-lactamase regulating signal transducer with metallopeptidase domain
MENKPNKPPEPKQPVGVYRPRTHIIRTLLILIIVGLVAVGFWRNWFVFTTRKSPESEKVDINLKVDTAKIKADTKRATELTKEEAKKLSREVKDEAKKLREPGK